MRRLSGIEVLIIVMFLGVSSSAAEEVKIIDSKLPFSFGEGVIPTSVTERKTSGNVKAGRLRLINGSVEEIRGTYPVQWGLYSGSGEAAWGVSDEAHSGRHSVYLKGIAFQKMGPGSSRYSNREVIGQSLVVGACNGYSGEEAYPCQIRNSQISSSSHGLMTLSCSRSTGSSTTSVKLWR